MDQTLELQQRLAPAIAEMRNNLSIAHSVSTLAALIGMSRSQFASAFRERFGRSPMEFLRGARLDSAARLLTNTTQPIKAISASVGYNSRSTFTHAFRSSFGVSPAEYRRASEAPKSPDIHSISQRLRTHSGSRQDLAWEVDLACGKIWWSESVFLTLGYDATKRTIADVARFYERIHPADRPDVLQSMQAACFDSKLIWEADFRFLKADNKTYALIANACLILRDQSGAATRLVGTMRLVAPPDATSRTRLPSQDVARSDRELSDA